MGVALTNSGGGGSSSLLGSSGIGLQAAGAASAAIGAFYSVKSAQYQAKSQALSLEFQESLSHINARAAERDAQQSLLAGQREAGRVGLQYRQIKESVRTGQAAGGIQAGVGSAAEVAASIEVAKQSDQIAITRNSVRAANAARTGRANALTRGQLAGVSADNLRTTAGALNPGLAGLTSLVGSAGRVARSNYALSRTR